MSSITSEQRERMEKNRQEALERLKKTKERKALEGDPITYNCSLLHNQDTSSLDRRMGGNESLHKNLEDKIHCHTNTLTTLDVLNGILPPNEVTPNKSNGFVDLKALFTTLHGHFEETFDKTDMEIDSDVPNLILKENEANPEEQNKASSFNDDDADEQTKIQQNIKNNRNPRKRPRAKARLFELDSQSLDKWELHSVESSGKELDSDSEPCSARSRLSSTGSDKSTHSSSDSWTGSDSYDSSECDDSSDYSPPDPGFYQVADAKRKKTSKKRKRVDPTAEEVEDSQEVSIHRILLNKFEKDESKTSLENIDSAIDHIIKYYNHPFEKSKAADGKKKSPGKNFNGRNKFNYEEIPLPHNALPNFRDDDWKLFEDTNEQPFRIRIFVQEVPKRIGLLHGYKIERSSKVFHTIVFHYRTNDLFALTTGQAWNVVQKYSDYDFPNKMAARLLTEKGQIETTNKVLVGNERQNKKTMKQHQETNPFELLQYCTSFIAEIRENSCMLRFSCFKNGKRAKFQMSLASVRILKRLKNSDFLPLLTQMSLINRGEITYPSGPSTSATVEPEIDTEVHSKYLSPTPNEDGKQLDTKLADDIRRAICGDSAGIGQYDICHKHMRDYAFASKFTLYHGTHPIKSFDQPPTLSSIILNIRKNRTVEHDLMKAKNIRTPEAFLHALNKVKLAFTKSGFGGETKEPLLNYIEGGTMGSDGRPYWRVMSIWCNLRNEYLSIVHSQWLDLLSKCLLEVDEAHLDLPWKEDSTVKSYLKQYKKRNTSHYVYEPENPEEAQHFDMLIIYKKQIMLYFLVPDLNHETLSKAYQMSNINKRIKTLELGAKANEGREVDLFTTLYNTRDGKFRYMVNKAFENLNGFLEALSGAKIVFAFGNDNMRRNEDAGVKATLERESLLKKKITIEDIEECMSKADFEDLKALENELEVCGPKKERSSRLATKIFTRLVQEEYVNPNGTIISKLHMSDQKNFSLKLESARLTAVIYDLVIKNYQSLYNTLVPKLGLIWALKEMNSGPRLHICKIPSS